MSAKIAFYLMNSKGYYVLNEFINRYGSESIAFIVSEKDSNLENDYYKEIKKLSMENSIVFFKRNKVEEEMISLFEGYVFVVGWRWIINNVKNLIVFHDSLLPKYRGFAPLVNSLVAAENEVGVTALFASPEYDKGDIILQKGVPIVYPIKIAEAISLVQPIYFELVRLIFEQLRRREEIIGKKQNESDATYSLWRDEIDYFVDWSESASNIENFVNAVGSPYAGARTRCNGKVFEILECEETEDVVVVQRGKNLGKIIFFRDNLPVVVCGIGLVKLRLREVGESEGKINFRSRFE